MLVDSHCHIDLPEFDGKLADTLKAMRSNNVGLAVCIGVTLEHFPRVAALADTHTEVLATVGVHPENTGVKEPDVDELLSLAAHPKVIGIGETGLD